MIGLTVGRMSRALRTKFGSAPLAWNSSVTACRPLPGTVSWKLAVMNCPLGLERVLVVVPVPRVRAVTFEPLKRISTGPW